MTTLLLSLVVLVGAAIGARALQRRRTVEAFLDGLVLVLIGGTALLVLLPHAFEDLGIVALLLAALGFLGPSLAERALSQRRVSRVVLPLALLGLCFHAALDGAALATVGDGAHHGGGHAGHPAHGLVLAVLVHRLPVGVLIGTTVVHMIGWRLSLVCLGALCGATVAGFMGGEALLATAGGPTEGVVAALLAGGLLHVVIGHGTDPGHDPACLRAGALGALLGVGALLFLPLEMPGPVVEGGSAIVNLALESSPAILLGFLGAGLLGLLPQERLANLMTGKTGFGSAVRGVVFGLPIPICSCGVVPLYRGLMTRGVPPAAAMAFLIATPELGVDAVLLSLPLLGWEMTLVRVGAAILVALLAGWVVSRLTPTPTEVALRPDDAPKQREASGFPVFARGVLDTLDELGPWLLAGLVVAGMLQPMIRPEWFSRVSDAAQVPVFVALSAPFYVCASAVTPLGAVLLAKGVAAGAVLALLITGPATNVSTWGAVRLFHSRATTALTLGALLGASLVIGLVVNRLPLPGHLGGAVEQGHAASLLQVLATSAFALLLAASVLRQGPRGFLGRLGLRHDHLPHDHPIAAGTHDHVDPSHDEARCGDGHAPH